MNLLKPLIVLYLLAMVAILSGCVTTGSNEAEKAAEIRRLAIAVHLYAEDHDGALPANWKILKPYLRDNQRTGEYELVAKGKLSDYPVPSEAILLQQKLANNQGEWMVAYLDAHIEIHKSDAVEAIPLRKRKKKSRY